MHGSMALELKHDPESGLFELRIRGILKRAEFTEGEGRFAAVVDSVENPRVLVVMEHFGGWERGQDWDNLDFMLSHGNKISKIAVVGAGRKEDEVRIFSGAGIRTTQVEFFDAGHEAQAREWLMS